MHSEQDIYCICLLKQFVLLFICCAQPLRLEIKKELTARSDRVKSVDLHPTEVFNFFLSINKFINIYIYIDAFIL